VVLLLNLTSRMLWVKGDCVLVSEKHGVLSFVICCFFRVQVHYGFGAEILSHLTVSECRVNYYP